MKWPWNCHRKEIEDVTAEDVQAAKEELARARMKTNEVQLHAVRVDHVAEGANRHKRGNGFTKLFQQGLGGT